MGGVEWKIFPFSTFHRSIFPFLFLQDLAAILSSAEFSGVLPTAEPIAQEAAHKEEGEARADEQVVKEEGDAQENKASESRMRTPSPSAMGALGEDGDADGKEIRAIRHSFCLSSFLCFPLFILFFSSYSFFSSFFHPALLSVFLSFFLRFSLLFHAFVFSFLLTFPSFFPSNFSSSFCIFKCVLASLYEGLSVRMSVSI